MYMCVCMNVCVCAPPSPPTHSLYIYISLHICVCVCVCACGGNGVVSETTTSICRGLGGVRGDWSSFSVAVVQAIQIYITQTHRHTTRIFAVFICNRWESQTWTTNQIPILTRAEACKRWEDVLRKKAG